MLFNSYEFVLLVAVTFCLFYLPWLKRWQTGVLIAAGIAFYTQNHPKLLIVLFASIAINGVVSFQVARMASALARRVWATAGVAANVAMLVFFKYSPLIARTFASTTNADDSVGQFLLSVPLPLGVSFYTFQGISLVVDTYRQRNGDRKVKAIPIAGFWPHMVNTALFQTFFPKVSSGPIVKAYDYYPQIARPKLLADIPWEHIFRTLIVGYFLKMVVADNLKDITYWLAYPQFLGFPTLTLVSLLVAYSMQLFADFAGYSLIAIGVAALFGYRLMENFNFPYIAQSLSEFWQRWHISLSSWIKEYLYFPLGGSRKGELRTYINLIVVMTIGGLWHGAAWGFATWGFFNGLGLAVERLFTSGRTSEPSPRWALLRMLWVFSFITFVRLFFKLPQMEHVLAFAKACWNNTKIPNDPVMLGYIILYSIPVILYHAQHWYRTHHPEWFKKQSVRFESVIYAACLTALVVNSGSAGQFIYFQF